MIKKIFTLLLVITAFISFHACELPSSVEVKVGLGTSLPIGPKSGDMTGLFKGLMDDVLKGIEDDSIQIVNYNDPNKVDGKEVLTFLVKYTMTENVDFSGELDGVTKMLNGLDDFELDFNLNDISLADMGTIKEGGDLIEVFINEMLEKTEDTFNNNVENSIKNSVPLVVGVGDNKEMEKNSFPFTIDGYESVTFKSCKLYLNLKIDYKSGLGNINDVDFYFTSVNIEEEGGHVVANGTDEYNNTTTIRFTGSDLTKTVTFDLEEKTLKNKFYIVLNGFEDDTPKNGAIILELSIDSHTADNSIKIRGVEGFVIEEGEKFEGKIDGETIDLSFGEDFLHAEVGSGNIEFEVDFPTFKPDYVPADDTWIRLHNGYETNIYMWQEPKPDVFSNMRNGLSAATESIGNSYEYWKYEEGNNNLAGKHFNKEIVDIRDDSNFKLKAGRVDFSLCDKDIEDKSIKVPLTPKLTLNNFSFLHLKAGDLLDVKQPDPISLAEAAEYLTEITFERVGVVINVGEFDIEGLSVMIREENLKINLNSDYKPMEKNKPLDFTNINQTLKIKDDNGNILVPELKFEVDIDNPGTDDVLELKNVDLSKGKIELGITSYKTYFKDSWSEAKVDLSEMDDVEKEFSLDSFSAFNENLSGFTFNHVNSYLYIDGDESIFKLEPDISLRIEYDGEDGPPLYVGDELVYEVGPIPEIFNDFAEPLKGTTIDFSDVLNNPYAGEKKLFYKIGLDKATITPTVLEKLTGMGDATIDIAIFIVLPMSLTAGDDGAVFIIPNMFNVVKDGENSEENGEEGEGGLENRYSEESSDESNSDDMFGRTGDFSITEMIKKLKLKISLNDEIFNGGTLFMRRADEKFDDPLQDVDKINLKFPLSGKSMNVAITGKMLDEINKVNPYIIEEMGIVFKPKKGLTVPRNLLVKNISFDVDIAYEQKFEF